MNISRSIRRLASAVLLLTPLFLLQSLPASAQTAGTASIQGTVTDPTGAAIPNAKVTLTNTDTGTARNTVSDGSGLYSLPNVPVGPYSFTVAATGFQGFTQKGVLEVGNNTQINAPLTVGSSSEHVEVQAQGVALETETSTFKQVIDQKRITELPLNGRQATQLILISGGAVNAPTNDLTGSKNYFSSTAIAVAGSQGNYNNYVLDGGTNVDTFTNTNLPYPFPDALREFSVESNSLPARNGIHPGSLVNVVTNSGTNQWHGTVFDFIRNNVVNATNFFSTAKDTVKRNQFGGTVGGKVITDKMFFFGGYQGTRNRQVGNSTSYCLPTAAELAGDFSQQGGLCPASKIGTTAGAPNPLVNPANGALINTDPTKPNYRKVDPSTYAAPSLALLKYLPLGLADQYGRINIALPANYSEDQYIGRVDYTFNQKHNLFGRFFLANYNQPAYFSPTNLLLTTTAGNDERVMNFTLGDTYILTPKLVNTFHGSYARRRTIAVPPAASTRRPSASTSTPTFPLTFGWPSPAASPSAAAPALPATSTPRPKTSRTTSITSVANTRSPSAARSSVPATTPSPATSRTATSASTASSAAPATATSASRSSTTSPASRTPSRKAGHSPPTTARPSSASTVRTPGAPRSASRSTPAFAGSPHSSPPTSSDAAAASISPPSKQTSTALSFPTHPRAPSSSATPESRNPSPPTATPTSPRASALHWTPTAMARLSSASAAPSCTTAPGSSPSSATPPIRPSSTRSISPARSAFKIPGTTTAPFPASTRPTQRRRSSRTPSTS